MPCPSFLFLLIHAEHALGDEEAAEDIDARHDNRGEAQQLRNPTVGGNAARRFDTDGKKSANYDHREIALVTDINGVCNAGVTLHTT